MSESINILEISIGLLGGLALFLYGMHEMSEALKADAGEGMKTLLAKLTTKSPTLTTHMIDLDVDDAHDTLVLEMISADVPNPDSSAIADRYDLPRELRLEIKSIDEPDLVSANRHL